MAKTLLFYSSIFSYSVSDFIEKLSQIDDSEDLVIKLNSPGGSVHAGWSMAQAISERSGKTTIITEGIVASMALVVSMFADEVKTLDVTNWMVHRAVYDSLEDEDDKKFLLDVNKKLKEKIKARIDGDVFKDVTGVTIDDVFDENKERRSIWLTSKDAKKIGFVNSIIKLQPKQLMSMSKNIVAFYDKDFEISNNYINQKTKVMTKEELKLQHPEVYNSIFAEGVSQEHDRVLSLLAYNEVDSKAVMEFIKSGKFITETFRSEMAVKQMANVKLKTIQDESPKDLKNEGNQVDGNTPEDVEVEAFKKGVMSKLGLTEKMEG